MMTHEQYQELLAASALTALDAADAHALSSHLESCTECRAEVAQWQETAALMALEAQPLEPSQTVRERILASIREEPRTVDSAARIQPPPTVVPFAQPTRNIWQSFGSFGAIAAMIIFAALLISVLVLWRQNQNFKAE